MKKHTDIQHDLPHGFTLTEMAVVLVIVSLLLGGLLMPISTQQEQRYRSETQKNLAEIRDAIIGYAIINKKLPCPVPFGLNDPTNAAYGVAASSCAPSAEGYLPWKTLGVREVDGWGTPRTSSGDAFIGYWRYRVDANFATTFTISTTPTSGLSIKDNNSNTLTPSEGPIAIVYSTGADKNTSGLNTTGSATSIYQYGEVTGTFDDMLIWLSRPLVFSRMVSAGAL